MYSHLVPDEPSKRVAIWRWEWLRPSETFVRRHADNLDKFVAVAVGGIRMRSTLERDSDVVLYNSAIDRLVWSRLFKYLGIGVAPTRFLRQYKISLVHVHFGTDVVGALPAIRRSKLPFVITLHGFDVCRAPWERGWRTRWYRHRLRQAFRSADAILAVSKPIAAKALELGAPVERLRVLHLGIEPGDVVTAHHCVRDVLFVGRLVEKKGADDLIRAMRVAKDQGREISALLVGSGPEEESLRALAATLQVDVEFGGFMQPAEVRELMATSRIAVIPSKTAKDGDMEGLPTVAMEALAAGLAVVSTDHSGLEEIIFHERTGLVSPEGDHVALAQNMLRMLTDSSLRLECRLAGRSLIEQEFDLNTQIAELEMVYEEVLAKASDKRR